MIDAVELISEWPAALGSLARLLGVPVHALAHTNDLDLIGLDLGAVNVVSSVPASAAPPGSGLGGSGALRRDDTRVDLSAGLLSAVMALLLLNNNNNNVMSRLRIQAVRLSRHAGVALAAGLQHRRHHTHVHLGFNHMDESDGMHLARKLCAIEHCTLHHGVGEGADGAKITSEESAAAALVAQVRAHLPNKATLRRSPPS